MKNMTLLQIAKACSGQLNCDELQDQREVQSVVLDSRRAEQDCLFIATVGERVDGHDFIDQVFDKGALAVICEKAPASARGPYILVENSFAALKDIATWYRMQLDLKVVGITGSVGKTSTKEFISSVLSQKYHVLKTEGNFNNEIGMPLTILKIRDEHQIAVLEMGISDFGEMHRLSEIAKPDICVITNIGQCHLENLGSREGILKAKTEIFDFMSDDGAVCINGDDDLLATIREVKGRQPLRFGFRTSNDFFASDIITHGLFGSSCNIRTNYGGVFPADVPLPGGHMVLNALAATAVGSLLGVSEDAIREGIKRVLPVGGRSNIIAREQLTIIDDCYNANPVSMKAAIDLLKMADTNKVAILGDMFELGSREKELHRDVGAYAASGGLHLIICVGTLSYHMYEGADEILRSCSLEDEKSDTLLYYFETRDELIKALPNLIHSQDTVLIKASHGMAFEIVVNSLLSSDSFIK